MFIETTALGRLTKDVETKVVKINGEDTTIAEFTLACDVGFGKNKRTEFLDCTAWRKAGETIAQYCVKGSTLFVKLTPETDKFEVTKEGVTFKTQRTKYTVTEFKFAGGKSSDKSADDGDAPF